VKIIANGIANLTDARYFAAMGVDWIGFDVRLDSPLSIEHVMAFADWVEGPQFFLDVRGRSDDQIAEILGSFLAEGLLTDKATSLTHYAGKIITVLEHESAGNSLTDTLTDTLIYTQEQWQEGQADKQLDEAADVWIEIRNVTDYHILKGATNMISGIVLSGGNEEKVGVKSYDDLDELIDFIRG
jgi:phosphoribosylanthranilate isomerase